MAAAQVHPRADAGPIVEITGLKTGFGDHTVLEHLDLAVMPGEVLAIVGASGSGKSVLLDTMIGLKPAQAGSVKVFGEALKGLSERKSAEIDHRWGVMFQGGALFSNLTVRSNIAVPMIEHGAFDREDIAELVDLKLALVGLEPEVGCLKPSELSGGMLKRVSLARALSLDPELLFLDEPTAGLDPVSASAFDVLIRDLSQSLGFTVILITHDLDTLYAITDRVAVVAERRVVACGPVQTIEQSDHPWIHEYFHGRRGRAASVASRLAAEEPGSWS